VVNVNGHAYKHSRQKRKYISLNQNNDDFVIEADSGDDTITDFSNSDTIIFSGVAGVDDFRDLTLTKVGSNTVITWGTTDSLTVEGYKPNQLHASDFEFTAAASLATAEVSREAIGGFGHSSSGFDAFDHGHAHLAPELI